MKVTIAFWKFGDILPEGYLGPHQTSLRFFASIFHDGGPYYIETRKSIDWFLFDRDLHDERVKQLFLLKQLLNIFAQKLHQRWFYRMLATPPLKNTQCIKCHSFT